MRLPVLVICLAALVSVAQAGDRRQTPRPTSDQINVWVRIGENWQQYSVSKGATLSQLAEIAKLHCDLKDSDDTLWRYDVSRKEADKTEKHRFKPNELKSAKGATFVLKDGDIVSLAMILIN